MVTREGEGERGFSTRRLWKYADSKRALKRAAGKKEVNLLTSEPGHFMIVYRLARGRESILVASELLVSGHMIVESRHGGPAGQGRLHLLATTTTKFRSVFACGALSIP